ncbi:hypothetical protein D3C81_307520 [compost metagenome]
MEISVSKSQLDARELMLLESEVNKKSKSVGAAWARLEMPLGPKVSRVIPLTTPS